MTRLLLQIFSLSRPYCKGEYTDPHQRSMRLHLLFLGPLVLTISVLVITFVVVRYQQSDEEVQATVFQLESTAQSFYDDGLRKEIHAMRGIIEVMMHRDDITSALANQDRKALLRITEEQFNGLKRHFNITHFYFMNADRVNLLRVHAPWRYGDTINRITMLQAEGTHSIASGVELGALGTFTLRVVAPWYDQQQKLIGYVELGMEIGQLLEHLQASLDLRLITVINKTYLDRDNWVKGMTDLGRDHDWDHFQDIVINKETTSIAPLMLVDFLEREGSMLDFEIREMIYRNREYRVIALPLMDAGGRKVAQIIMTIDVTQVQNDARDAAYTVSIAALIFGSMLVVFFYWLIGGITQRLNLDEKELRELATRDGLTNLYNQRTFYSMLKDDIDRAYRYQRPVSLLLLDIDHFKVVNDTYGHLAGDAILRGLSQRLISRLRTTDRLCRYGGEELTMILPEVDVIVAAKVAEGLRQLIEREPFYIGEGQSINITVSIGVAAYPYHGKEAKQLVSGADIALYEAKGAGRNRVCIYQSKA
ncbi:MAG: diguanylate cyclase [Gammaproteobacteria bacterium]|nr:diguanylate cyclase [Gammaproteobacteria bacterium]